jgi:hypothetical protein
MPDYRILVTGSRTWSDEALLSFELGAAAGDACKAGHQHAGIVIVHGACPEGADAMADRIAQHYGYRTEPHPADWRTHGKAAGPVRNAEMVALGASVALAFIMPCADPKCRKPQPHGSHGASHCADLAERSGIEVRRFTDGG